MVTIREEVSAQSLAILEKFMGNALEANNGHHMKEIIFKT